MGGDEKDFPSYTVEEVALHNTIESLWVVIKGKVYDVTDYVANHPGGADVLLKNAGTDITATFDASHKTKIPLFIAENLQIGILSAPKTRKPSLRPEGQTKHSAKSDGKGSEGSNSPLTGSTEYTFTPFQCDCLVKQFDQLVVVAGSAANAGNLIYTSIFTALGPVAKTLFKSPQKVVAFRVITLLERLIRGADDQHFLETELYNASMRHLGYVSPEEMSTHMKSFTTSMMSVIQNALDEYWNSGVENIWRAFFGCIAAHFLKNSQEFGGKVRLLRSSWEQVQSLKTKDSGGGFGTALFFNIGVMSPEIAALLIRDRTELASLFDSGFSMMVKFIADPLVLKEELYVLAARHLSYGAEEHHFPLFAQAIMVTLRSLLPRSWNWDHEDAWGWLWTTVSEFMKKSIADGHAHKQRLDDSMARLETADLGELGSEFYMALFESSSKVAQYFYKPNSLVKFIVSKVLKTLTSLLHSPDEVTHGVRALGMRHIKYGIPPDLFPCFGEALAQTLPNFLPGFWDIEIRDAWLGVFEFVKNCMTRAVVSGTTLVTKALVNNNVEDCKTALDGAARNMRLLLLLELDVSNIKVSPFIWALQDGKLDVATFMLDDILAIRADRESYYYGKDELFRVHPDLVEILCRLAPKMLFNVFDGLMWQSRNVVDGYRRVNYYIGNVYGNPNEDTNEDSFATPLAHLTRLRQPDLFTHPFLHFLVQLKWQQFGRSVYLRSQVLNILTLLCFMLGNVTLDVETDVALVFRSVAVALALYMIALQLRRVVSELRTRHVVRLFPGVYLPLSLLHPSNSARLVANIAMVSAFVMDSRFSFSPNMDLVRVRSAFQGIASCLLCALLIDLSHLSISLLEMRHSMRVVAPDMLTYLPSAFIIVVGFSCAMVLAEGPQGSEKVEDFRSVWACVLNLFAISLGLYNFKFEHFSLHMLILYILYSMFTMFLLGRFLQGIMSTLLILTRSGARGFAYLERANLLLEIESSCKLQLRKRVWENMALHKNVEFDAGDVGPSGCVQVLEGIGDDANAGTSEDRIIRFPGQCSPDKPWPARVVTNEEPTEQRLNNLVQTGEKVRRLVVKLQQEGFATATARLPTLDETSSVV